MLQKELIEDIVGLRYEQRIPGVEKKYRNSYRKVRHLTIVSGSFPIRVARFRVPF